MLINLSVKSFPVITLPLSLNFLGPTNFLFSDQTQVRSRDNLLRNEELVGTRVLSENNKIR